MPERKTVLVRYCHDRNAYPGLPSHSRNLGVLCEAINLLREGCNVQVLVDCTGIYESYITRSDFTEARLEERLRHELGVQTKEWTRCIVDFGLSARVAVEGDGAFNTRFIRRHLLVVVLLP